MKIPVDVVRTGEIYETMQRIADRFPMFEEFEPEKVLVVFRDEKKLKKIYRAKGFTYPASLETDKAYLVEIQDAAWADFDESKRNMLVFKFMVSVPMGGFDPDSKEYAKIKKPDYEMYAEEFAACGGNPDWINCDVTDPMEQGGDSVERQPVQQEDIEEV